MKVRHFAVSIDGATLESAFITQLDYLEDGGEK